ncbi:MAG: ribbon-helix-helix domain-containing protein [bacterium]|nr:ribbon-helix-helix domain-containing protein [bacterium]
MRNIINVSLPATLTKEVERGVKKYHFASKSEFVRHLIREWMAERLAFDLKESRKEYKTGKAKKLKEIKELWT